MDCSLSTQETISNSMPFRLLNSLFTFTMIVVLIWTIGLYVFSLIIQKTTEESFLENKKFEALVVLTGGQNRIDTALALFEAGFSDKLFISGVTQPQSLQQRIDTNENLRGRQECCIVLDEIAADTIGNATESTKWLDANNIHSILLVTSNYHMPRSLLEFKKKNPHLVITPYAIEATNVPLDRWWQRDGTRRLIFSEYNKFLFSAAKYYTKRGIDVISAIFDF